MLRAVIILGCLSATLANYHSPIRGNGTHGLTRCPRVMGTCAEVCHHGYRMDEHHCPTCECQIDPCEGVECEGDLHCHPRNCFTQDCTDSKHSCIPEMCEHRECNLHCEHGFLHNDLGCPTCQCRENPCKGHTCQEGQVCHLRNCHNVDCSEAKYTCSGPHYTDMEPVPFHPCAMPMCAQECEFGYAKDEHQCDTCDCLSEAPKIQEKLCSFHKHLLEQLEKEMEHHGPVPDHVREHLQPHAQCNDDGSFKPMQCHPFTTACWCVDDRGMELKDTRVDTSVDAKPDCVHHVTQRIEMLLVLRHDYDNVNEHIEGIRGAVSSHLSDWMGMKEEFIEVFEVVPSSEPGKHGIVVSVNLHRDEESELDINYVAQKFAVDVSRHDHVMECPEGGNLYLEKHVSFQHHTQPHLPDDQLREISEEIDRDEDENSSSEEEEFDMDDKVGILAAVGGFLFCVLSIVAVVIGVMICRKKAAANAQFKHSRMDNYKENLAFQNDLMRSGEKATVVSIVKTDELPGKY